MSSQPATEQEWLWCIVVTPTSVEDKCGTEAMEH